MKASFIKTISFLIFAVLVIFFQEGTSQSLHVDYKQVVGMPHEFEVEIWVSNQTQQPCHLSALNNVFGFVRGLDQSSSVTLTLAEKYKNLATPINSLISSKKIIRATQVPVLNSAMAVPVSEKPELFGVLKVKSNPVIKYPLVLTPSIEGNPTVQSIVYFGNSINSTALTLQSASITTDENPLVLKLMGQQIAVAEDDARFHVYPNPTTHFVYFDFGTPESENYQVELFNQNGTLVRKISQNDLQAGFIDLSTYASGSYFLRATMNSETVQWKKVIKIE